MIRRAALAFLLRWGCWAQGHDARRDAFWHYEERCWVTTDWYCPWCGARVFWSG